MFEQNSRHDRVRVLHSPPGSHNTTRIPSLNIQNAKVDYSPIMERKYEYTEEKGKYLV